METREVDGKLKINLEWPNPVLDHVHTLNVGRGTQIYLGGPTPNHHCTKRISLACMVSCDVLSRDHAVVCCWNNSENLGGPKL